MIVWSLWKDFYCVLLPDFRSYKNLLVGTNGAYPFSNNHAKWKEFTMEGPIFHFHDCGRKSISHQNSGNVSKGPSFHSNLNGCEEEFLHLFTSLHCRDQLTQNLLHPKEPSQVSSKQTESYVQTFRMFNLKNKRETFISIHHPSRTSHLQKGPTLYFYLLGCPERTPKELILLTCKKYIANRNGVCFFNIP